MYLDPLFVYLTFAAFAGYVFGFWIGYLAHKTGPNHHAPAQDAAPSQV